MTTVVLLDIVANAATGGVSIAVCRTTDHSNQRIIFILSMLNSLGLGLKHSSPVYYSNRIVQGKVTFVLKSTLGADMLAMKDLD